MTELNKDARTWAMFAHLASLLGYTVIPFGNIVGPLVVWLMKKDEYPFVDEQGKESLNFQISIMIYAFISGILIFVLVGIVLLGIVYLAGLILSIIAAVKANNGESYRYPLTIRLLK